MKKEQFLENLLSKAEKIDSRDNYLGNMDFAFAYAYLRVPEISEDKTGEYLLFKNSNVLTYKRIHAFISKNENGTFMYLFKNSVPGRIRYSSTGNDSDLFSQRLLKDLLNTVKMYEDKSVNEKGPAKLIRIKLPRSYYNDDIQEDREYVLNNIRRDKYGEIVCWHIYPKVENDKIILDILEHSAPGKNMILDVENNNEINEDVHFIPVQKDKKAWKDYMKKEI